MRITKKAEPQAPVSELATYVEYFTDAKKAADEAAKQVSFYQERIIKLLEQDGKKHDVVYVGGRDLKVTAVAAERVKFNETMLQRILGKRAFAKVCDLKLNNTLLNDAIKAGAIDPNLIAEASTIVTNAPYVRVSLNDEMSEATSE